jgi:DNA topoisomerase II
MSPKSIEEQYQKLTHREHVLQRSDTYIGSIITEPKEMYLPTTINDLSGLTLAKQTIDFNPGLIKLYDEILTNASDHSIRTSQVKKIKITVQPDHIIIENDGPGIPIEMHQDEKIYVPELLFGELISGENFDDTEDRVVGGRNGLGAKLTNVWSNKFIVECADGQKKFVQTFTNNMAQKTKPKITKLKRSYTKITFYPDLDRFGLEVITEDIQKILLRRALDVSVYCPQVKIYFNGELIPVRNFKDYMTLFLAEEREIFHEKINERWEFGVALTEEDEMEQISLANGITTYEGGTHINRIRNQLVQKIKTQLQKKYKEFKFADKDIARKLFLFVNTQIVNPQFNTQTKEKLISKMNAKQLGDGDISNNLIKKIVDSEIIEGVINWVEAKQNAKLANQTKKKNRPKIRKLDDANKAGSSKANQCALFLTEGDSAKSTAMRGLSVLGRDYYGVYPLKGKPLNVRDVTKDKIAANAEIKDIITAIGLQYGTKYHNTKDLRYGKVVIMSDQDYDGYHIKGLLINLFDAFWPELLQMDFLYEFITPIVRISKGNEHKYFYRLVDYKKWRDFGQTTGWFIKYYKGLGTIEPKESKKFFKEINKHLIRFHYRDEERTEDLIDMAFRKKRADDRKDWLLAYNPQQEIDKFTETTTIDSFIERELIEYSMESNIRQIPSVVDGLKPSQRKILYTMFTKNFKNQVKVSQLSGAIIEKAAYHHGPDSLDEAIVGLSQDFVGANNLNLLLPKGEFGSRVKGGKDCSASRYIFTCLNPLTRKIFRPEDDLILNYKKDDGQKIEPDWYLPILPFILINGANGIGTGYSTTIPAFNPNEIARWYTNKLQGKQNRKKILPFYRDFQGEIIWDDENQKYLCRGVIKSVEPRVYKITELPIGIWADNYLNHLDKMIEDKKIQEYEKDCNGDDIWIQVTTRQPIESDLYKYFSLEKSISTNNFHAFNPAGVLKKYADHYQIMEEFYDFRLEWYQKRKDYQLTKMKDQGKILTQKIRFIKAYLEDKIELKNKTKAEIVAKLKALKIKVEKDSYDYLLNMSLLSLSKEKITELNEQYQKLKNKVQSLEQKTPHEIWLEDLEELKKK